MTYYVYTYSDPITKIPFYVGKGTGLRMYKHLSENYKNTENKKKYAVIQSLKNKGLEPIVEKVVDRVSEQTAYDIEAHLIKSYGRRDLDEGGILTNICVDNRPPNATGRKLSAQQKKKLSESRKGKGNPMYGKPAHNRGKPGLSGEDNPFYGRSHSKETRRKMSIAAKNRPKRPMKEKIKKQNSVYMSEEHRKKIQQNNPNRKSINTPYGIYPSAEDFATQRGDITANGVRKMTKNPDKIISRSSALRNPLLNETHIGKTLKEVGYYEID